MVYVVPLDSACRSEAATVTSQVLSVSEQVSVTPLMTIETVWPFSAPDVVTVTVPALLSSTALR